MSVKLILKNCFLIADTFLLHVAELDGSAIDTCMIFPVSDLTTVTDTMTAITTPVTRMVNIFSVFQCNRHFGKNRKLLNNLI